MMKPMTRTCLATLVFTVCFAGELARPDSAAAQAVGAPTISSIFPDHAERGDAINIRGTNLNTVTEVRFGDITAPILGKGPNTISLLAPSVPPGGQRVRVISPQGTAQSASTYIVASVPEVSPMPTLPANGDPTLYVQCTASHGMGVVAPRVTSISSPTQVDSAIILSGSGLAGASVKFSGSTTGIVGHVNSSSQNSYVNVTVPPGARSGPLCVTSATGTVSTAVVLINPPTIGNFYPKRGEPGTLVLINGTQFQHATSVRFGQFNLRIVDKQPNNLTVEIPAGATSAHFRVTTPWGDIWNPGTFKVGPCIPLITRFTPDPSPTLEALSIEGECLMGSSGSNVPDVRFGDIRQSWVGGSAPSLNLSIPQNVPLGISNVTVSTNVGTAFGSVRVVAPSPMISSVSPTQVTVGAYVVLRGRHLRHIGSLYVNGVIVPRRTEQSDGTELTYSFQVPDTTSGLIAFRPQGGVLTTTAIRLEIIRP